MLSHIQSLPLILQRRRSYGYCTLHRNRRAVGDHPRADVKRVNKNVRLRHRSIGGIQRIKQLVVRTEIDRRQSLQRRWTGDDRRGSKVNMPDVGLIRVLIRKDDVIAQRIEA